MAVIITYNGKITEVEAGKTATLSCNGKKALSPIVMQFTNAGSISYNGKITEVEAGKTATLQCEGKKMMGDVYVTVQKKEDPNFLTLSSPSAFTLGVVDNKRYWDGTLEYSTDANTWNVWDGTSAISSSTDGQLYVRGTGNTYITGSSASSSAGAWRLNGSNISISGNIETLLDYTTVANGEHPTMGGSAYRALFAYPESTPNSNITDVSGLLLPATTLAISCYNSMFQACTGLTTPPALPATTLADDCYYGMFNGCTGLTTAPALPATTLAISCYTSMFRGCTGLTTAPALPATTLITYCYQNMFYGCIALITLPALPATKLQSSCYRNMFQGCSSIKISTTKTDEYQNEYRIPTAGSGSTTTMALNNMFYKTGGTFTGAPTINTTYYTSNTVV